MHSIDKNKKRPPNREFEISFRDRFPIPVKFKDSSNRIVKTYYLVRTKRDGLMLQK